MSSPWSAFKVGTPSTRENWVEPDCCPLTRVFHVAHIKEALRVLEDGRIRSGLIYDESRLNTNRTSVSWVSPNTWVNGSIYGHVQFRFDWKDLISGKTIYWVEAPKTNRQQIVRLLICDGQFVDEKLEEYGASLGDGPLYHDAESDRWYYNDRLTNEYMILSDLQLDDCVGISFCDHHRSICKKKFGPCKDKQRKGREVGADVLGRCIGVGWKKWANKVECYDDSGFFDMYVADALAVLCKRLSCAHSGKAHGTIPESTAKSLIASMCTAASYAQSNRLKNLAALFASSKHIEATFWKCANEFFNGLKVRAE